MTRVNQNFCRRAFTLVELLVVIGIIAVLISILLPSLAKARKRAEAVQCMSNERQIGMALLTYADQWDGVLFPGNMGWSNNNVYLHTPGDGTLANFPTATDPLQLTQPDQANSYTYNVWPLVVLSTWNTPLMTCPSDLQPLAQHTYILNNHMAYYNEKYGRTLPNHMSPSDAVLMGEKVSTVGDYYMEYGDYAAGKVDEFRHGLIGSNYLMLDMHVDSLLINTSNSESLLDPWDFGSGSGPTSQPSE